MSFKRDGNDSGLLSVLQKRRIRDLLAEDIPEDEAKLLSNGRLTCLVCSSYPIFDTIDMLSVHRKGKKHNASAEFHERKKKELKQLIAKRRHEQFVNTGSASIKVAPSSYQPGISTSSPYDARARRHNNKARPGDRKTCLDLQQNGLADTNPKTLASFNSTSSANSSSEIINAGDRHSSPSSSSHWYQICDQQLRNGHVKHDSQLKNIFQKKTSEPFRLHPYTSKHRSNPNTKTNHSDNDSDASSQMACYTKSGTKQTSPTPTLNFVCGQGTVKHGQRLSNSSTSVQGQSSPRSHGKKAKCVKTCLSSSISSSNTNTMHPSSSQVHSLLSSPAPHSHSQNATDPLSLAWKQVMPIASVQPPQKVTQSQPPQKVTQSQPPQKVTQSQPPQKVTQSQPPQKVTQPQPAATPSPQKTLALEYHRLQGSGWKRDWDGKWMKDEEAEFDSDEEPPDLP